MRIAISMRVHSTNEHDEIRDGISHDWQNWLAAQKIDLYPVPNNIINTSSYLAPLSADGLILSGGNDLITVDKSSKEIGAIRRRTEFDLIASALAAKLPIFGVCRGMHVINQYFNGQLTPDIKSAGAIANHISAFHSVKLSPPFTNIAGTENIDVNSYHNQGVFLHQVATDLAPIATLTQDRLVEGLVHRKLPILAIQWHPERVNTASEFDVAIFKRLIDEGAFWKDALL